MVKRRLIRSNVLRGQYHYAARANAEIKAVITKTEEGYQNKYTMRSCREAAMKMEEILISVGGAHRLVTTVRYFRERPVVRELGKTKDLIDGSKTGKHSTKEEQLRSLVMGDIKDFFTMFHRP